jgi:hypothetical protein
MPEHKTLSAPYEPLRPPEYKRNELGQFSRPGKTLAKTAKKTGLTNKLIKKSDGNQLREPDGRYKNGGARPGAGRPKGSPNKVSASLKEMILQSLEELGGKEYLKTLAIENSSAYTSLIGKVLPTTLAPESDGGSKTIITFKRVIVSPAEPKVIEHQPPASPMLPRADGPIALDKEIKDLDQDTL